MYATSSPGGVYHLLSDANDQTLCGLSVAPIVIDRPVTTFSLHLTSQQPEEGENVQRLRRDRINARR